MERIYKRRRQRETALFAFLFLLCFGLIFISIVIVWSGSNHCRRQIDRHPPHRLCSSPSNS
ncbi:unnamed protein product [Citrullus colocynthis]|uniref:Uncharacterized protein n=1 Tax=Citrullus colocynthis TaxID=252529 RepID=A0ABP0Y7Z9_9ROSI